MEDVLPQSHLVTVLEGLQEPIHQRAHSTPLQCNEKAVLVHGVKAFLWSRNYRKRGSWSMLEISLATVRSENVITSRPEDSSFSELGPSLQVKEPMALAEVADQVYEIIFCE